MTRDIALNVRHQGEIARVRGEYKRRAQELPPDLYGWNRPVNLFFHCQLVRACIQSLVAAKLFPLEGRRIADIGCGKGIWLQEFSQWGAAADSLSGIDLDECRIGEARRRLASADLQVGDACRLPWPSHSFDLVTQFTLFTSILDAAVRQKIAQEMLRVLKADGAILWYDFHCDNPRNQNVRGIRASEIQSLFPDCTVSLRRVTLAPPLARRIAPVSWICALLLESIPLLTTHYLGLVRRTSKEPTK